MRCIGLISGTSVDGIDCALLEIDGGQIELVGYHSHPYPAGLRRQLLALTERPSLSLSEFGLLDNAVANCFADAAQQLLAQQELSAGDVDAIGSHGQNIWHQPERHLTLQIGNPSVIAARTGITTVADFRRKDVALGGQGAPLAPAFHQALFAQPGQPIGVLNIGGIANLSVLRGDTVTGFDTGPGNALMDAWHERHQGGEFDADGQWAMSGEVIAPLLQALMATPYLHLAPPKSTGRELFNLHWLEAHLQLHPGAPADVQRTLLEFTAQSAAGACIASDADFTHIAVCGGGAHNRALMQRLKELLPCPLKTTDQLGFPGDWIEAGAFAWFAAQTLQGQPASRATVTGARRDAILGGIYHP